MSNVNNRPLSQRQVRAIFRKYPKFQVRYRRDAMSSFITETKFIRADRCGTCKCQSPANIGITDDNGTTRIRD